MQHYAKLANSLHISSRTRKQWVFVMFSTLYIPRSTHYEEWFQKVKGHWYHHFFKQWNSAMTRFLPSSSPQSPIPRAKIKWRVKERYIASAGLPLYASPLILCSSTHHASTSTYSAFHLWGECCLSGPPHRTWGMQASAKLWTHASRDREDSWRSLVLTHYRVLITKLSPKKAANQNTDTVVT